MRYRQIHLDFHTSGLIPGIGRAFDADRFAAAYKSAYVDSITIFAKCHHGYSYHPTRVGQQHPGLDFDLTGAQLQALHKVGIKAPIYVTATWDELAANENPGWLIVSPDGSLPQFRAEYGQGAGWQYLDYASPYMDYLCAQLREVLARYPDCDGIFMDICKQLPNISAHAKKRMAAENLDWTAAADRQKFDALIMDEFYQRISDIVRAHDPKMPLFFNAGHIVRGARQQYQHYYSHLEIESLPTSFWGYDHFPLSARYAENIGLDMLGMTGKFHYSWGEVGGYKSPDALLYECAAMVAHGARCSLGDHLHPTGTVDPSTIQNIAPAYKWVADHEPWLEQSSNMAEIALLSAESVYYTRHGYEEGLEFGEDEGAVRILLESKLTFDIVDTEMDFSAYKLLILPDSIQPDAALLERVKAFLADGGRVLITGTSCIDVEHGPMLDIGADWFGASAYSNGDFILPRADLQASFVQSPLYSYCNSQRIKVMDGESLGDIHDPYFDRAQAQFSGHLHAPNKPEPSGYHFGSQKGGITCLALPVFKTYRKTGAVALLEIVEKVIRSALGESSMIETTLPRAGRALLRHQAVESRYILHLLHANPILRGQIDESQIQPIQDLTELHDIDIRIQTPNAIKRVKSVPDNTDIAFERDNDGIAFRLDSLKGARIIAQEY